MTPAYRQGSSAVSKLFKTCLSFVSGYVGGDRSHLERTSVRQGALHCHQGDDSSGVEAGLGAVARQTA